MVRKLICFALLSLTTIGCSSFFTPPWSRTDTARVRGPLFGEPPVEAKRKTNYPPSDTNIALRVDQVGRKILAANPQIGVKPVFAVIGVQKAEIYHLRPNFIHITEGLATKCRTEAELAAVLCMQLGKMVAERDALVSPKTRRSQQLPPINVPIGHAGSMSNSDGTYMVEMAKFEKTHPRRRKNDLPPDPAKLAQIYLKKAGYETNALEHAQPLLQEAAQNYSLEKHFNSTNGGAWIP